MLPRSLLVTEQFVSAASGSLRRGWRLLHRTLHLCAATAFVHCWSPLLQVIFPEECAAPASSTRRVLLLTDVAGDSSAAFTGRQALSSSRWLPSTAIMGILPATSLRCCLTLCFDKGCTAGMHCQGPVGSTAQGHLKLFSFAFVSGTTDSAVACCQLWQVPDISEKLLRSTNAGQ